MATASSSTLVLASTCPDRVATIRRPGRRRIRCWCLGSGVLTGWGLQSHEAGLPGAVADALAARSGRGVDLTVIADPELTSDRALKALPGLRLRRFDALVVVLGEDPAAQLLRPADWKRRATGLLAALVSHVDTGRRVFVYASSRAMLANSQSPSRRVWRRASKLDDLTARACGRAGVRYAELAPSLHGSGSAADSPPPTTPPGRIKSSSERDLRCSIWTSGSLLGRPSPTETVPRTRNCGRQRWKRCT